MIHFNSLRFCSITSNVLMQRQRQIVSAGCFVMVEYNTTGEVLFIGNDSYLCIEFFFSFNELLIHIGYLGLST